MQETSTQIDPQSHGQLSWALTMPMPMPMEISAGQTPRQEDDRSPEIAGSDLLLGC